MKTEWAYHSVFLGLLTSKVDVKNFEGSIGHVALSVRRALKAVGTSSPLTV